MMIGLLAAEMSEKEDKTGSELMLELDITKPSELVTFILQFW